MKTGMVTWRTNSAIHYIQDGKPLCGADVKYGEIWYTDGNEPTCHGCKRIYENLKKGGYV